MVNGSVSATPPWVTRSLWAISASLAVAILTVRGHGIAGDVQRDVRADRAAALATFHAPLAHASVPHAFDGIAWTGHAPLAVRAGVPLAVPAHTIVTLGGWALDGSAGQPFQTIAARVDHQAALVSAGRVARPDVATVLHAPHAEQSGFSLDFDTSTIGAGPHKMEVRALSSDGKSAYELGPAIAINVGAASAIAQTTDAIDAVNGIALEVPAAGKARDLHVLRSYRTLTIAGWGFASDGRRVPRGATLLVDGMPAATARYGMVRADVASAFHDVRFTRTGMEATLALRTLAPGLHELRFRLDLPDGASVDASQSITITLE